VIASLRGLAAVSVLALLLLALVVVARPTDAPQHAIDRTVIAPQRWHSVSRPDAVEITRPGRELAVENVAGARWQLRGSSLAAEPRTIATLVDTLAIARWHRRADPVTAEPLRGAVRLAAADAELVVGIGREVPGSQQSWIVHDHRAYLVDTWVVAAIWPDELALRLRQPLAVAGGEHPITIGSLELVHHRMLRPHAVWLDPALADELIGALMALEYVSLEDLVIGDPGLEIVVDASGERVSVRAVGTCPGDRVALDGQPAGPGCVERAAWQRIVAAASALERSPDAIADRRPVPLAPVKLVLADGTLVEVAGRPRVGSGDADPGRVAELLAALAAPAEVVSVPRSRASGTLVATDREGTEVALDIHASGIVARAGEPVMLRPTAERYAAITRPARMLVDAVLWREDESAIASVRIDGVTYTRGVVLGEWTPSPAGQRTADPALVDALASALASVRAPSGPPPSRIAHTVIVRFAPPAGAPSSHTLAIAAPQAGGCRARVDGAPVMIDLALCTAVHAAPVVFAPFFCPPPPAAAAR
jgi:hypothetical protein